MRSAGTRAASARLETSVLVEFTLRARGRTTGLDFGQEAVMVWQLRDGKAIRLYLYPTLEQAVAAVEQESSA
jgi:ketosteroid isomerase-like protein